MRSLKIVVSFFMLFLFGFSLSAEVLRPHSDQPTVSQSSEGMQWTSEKHCHEGGQGASEDFCASGFCHWGHCSFALRLADFNMTGFQNMDIWHFVTTALHQSPDLEGLRRPPRLS